MSDTLTLTLALEITFLANAGFVLHDGDVTLVTDFPYVPGAYGYATYDLEAALPLVPGDDVVAVITHRHTDHVSVERLRETTWRVIGPAEVTGRLEPDRVIPLADTLRVGAFTVFPAPTDHADTEHYSYVIEWRGRRIYLSGDTEDPSHLLSARPLDVAILTPWLMCEVTARGERAVATTVLVHHEKPGRTASTCLPHRRLGFGERMEVRAATAVDRAAEAP